jgi:hypothetical protein
MTRRSLATVLIAALALGASFRGQAAQGLAVTRLPLSGTVGTARPTLDLPARLTDAEFWRLTEELSEPNGYFRSDNLVSNELVFARVLPELTKAAAPGGVYLGVGPEQNFTYIAAIRPKLAVILDIRRGNLHLQLMYKALFELAADRAEFLSLLFTKPRPATLGPESTVQELMDAYWDIFPSEEPTYLKNLQAIKDVLVKKHGLPLPAEDLKGIEIVYRSFYAYGPSITWSSSTTGASGGSRATYKDLMLQADVAGQPLSYLASEERFSFLKDLEARNLVVPVVGDFGGPKALKAIGAYLKGLGAVVTAFYLSNVEQYLRQEGRLETFRCANVASLPLDAASVFIRPSGTVIGGIVSGGVVSVGQTGRSGTPMTVISMRGGSPIVPMMAEVKTCSGAGRPAPAPR